MNHQLWLDSVFIALLRASWQASVLIALVLLFRRVLQTKLRPEWRFWLWALVLLRLSLPYSLESSLSIFNYASFDIPAISRSEGKVEPEPAGIKGVAATDNSTNLESIDTGRVPGPERAGNKKLESMPGTTARPARIESILAIVWFTGVLALTLRLCLAHRRLSVRLRRDSPGGKPALLQLFRECVQTVGLRRHPLLVETVAVRRPCVFGLISPKLLLPSPVIQSFTLQQLRCVILHELCHLQRRDILLNWLTTSLQILHWFNPLVWLATREFLADRELACDEKALSLLGKDEINQYGQAIVRLVERLAPPSPVPSIIGIGENLGHLRLRLDMINCFDPRPKRWHLLTATAAVLFGLVTVTDAQTQRTGRGWDLMLQGCSLVRGPACACEPSPAVESALEMATRTQARLDPQERIQAQLKELRKLLAQYPRDIAVHLAYQRAGARPVIGSVADDVISEYRSLVQQHPDDPLYVFLYGNVLAWTDRVEARRYLESALQKDVTFVWPHLPLGRIDSIENKREQAVQHLRTYLSKCSCDPEGYSLLVRVELPEQALLALPKMRAALRRKTRPQDVWFYVSLWDVEFELRPIPEHGAVRKEIARDLAGLRRMNLVQHSAWWFVLQEGYKRAWNEEGLRWAKEEQARQLAGTSLGFVAAQQLWRELNPQPDRGASEETVRAHRRKYAEQSEKWTREWPDHVGAWLTRFTTLTSEPDTPLTEIDLTIDRLLEVVERDRTTHAVPSYPVSSVYISIASFYARRGVRLDRVPELVEKALRHLDSTPASYTVGQTPAAREMQRGQGLSLVVEAHLGMQQFDRARAALSRMKAFLAAGKNPGMATQYKLLQGRLAEAENRKAEAVSHYQSVLQDRARLKYSPVTKEPDPLIAKTGALWKDLRRPESGWQTWLAGLETIRSERMKSTTSWKAVQQPLPDFRLADAQGKIWTLSMLKGKTCFIHVWAVWSAKNSNSLDTVQELYDRVKDRPDSLFLTLNVDDYTPQIEPLIKERGYTFPVIPAARYVRAIRPFSGASRSWIVDKAGVIRMEIEGTEWGADGVNQIASMIAGTAPIQ